MRIDQFLAKRESEKQLQESERAKVVIYDPDQPETKQQPRNANVVFFLPDNGRD